MRKITVFLSVAALGMSYAAFANDSSYNNTMNDSNGAATSSTTSTTTTTNNANVIPQQAGTADAPSDYGMESSTADKGKLKHSGLEDEVFGFKVQAGDLNFRDPTGNIQNRNLIGFTAEMNASSFAANLTGMDTKNLFLGPQIGLFYSHIGLAQANFWGTDSAALSSSNGGANLLMLPLDLKVGGTVGPFRLALHGGGNIFYRTVSSSVALGYNPNGSSDSSWTILPNVGADIELGVTNAISLIVRPDLTFGGDNRLWAATVGVGIPLG